VGATTRSRTEAGNRDASVSRFSSFSFVPTWRRSSLNHDRDMVVLLLGTHSHVWTAAETSWTGTESVAVETVGTAIPRAQAVRDGLADGVAQTRRELFLRKSRRTGQTTFGRSRFDDRGGR